MPTKDEIRNFSLKIEELANIDRIHCVEAIVQYCEETGIEIEVAASLISPHLKSRIKEEAESINMLKGASKLPL